MFRVLVALVDDTADAEDALQETFPGGLAKCRDDLAYKAGWGVSTSDPVISTLEDRTTVERALNRLARREYAAG